MVIMTFLNGDDRHDRYNGVYGGEGFLKVTYVHIATVIANEITK